MVKLNKTLKAATLVESLIAMVIIIITLGIATMIYSNVLDSDKQRKQLKAIFLLKQELIKTKTEKTFLDSEEQINDWSLKKVVKRFDQTENLYCLSMSVLDAEGKTIAVKNELVIVTDNE